VSKAFAIVTAAALCWAVVLIALGSAYKERHAELRAERHMVARLEHAVDRQDSRGPAHHEVKYS